MSACIHTHIIFCSKTPNSPPSWGGALAAPNITAHTHHPHGECLLDAFHEVYSRGGFQSVVGAEGYFFQLTPYRRLGKRNPIILMTRMGEGTRGLPLSAGALATRFHSGQAVDYQALGLAFSHLS